MKCRPLIILKINMAIRFTNIQVLFIINKWKEDRLNKSISSNDVKLGNIKEEFNKEFGSNITVLQVQTKIKYLKKKYSEVSIYNLTNNIYIYIYIYM